MNKTTILLIFPFRNFFETSQITCFNKKNILRGILFLDFLNWISKVRQIIFVYRISKNELREYFIRLILGVCLTINNCFKLFVNVQNQVCVYFSLVINQNHYPRHFSM